MTQAQRLTRARQLTASVLLGKDGYASPAAARLRRLAAAGSTGMLPFTGTGEGAIYVRDGRVVGAESSRTPGPVPAAELASPADRLAAALAVAEPTVDAVSDLLADSWRPARFRSSAVPPAGLAGLAGPVGPPGLADGIAVDALLAEVARRQRITGQLAAVLTADTTVVRNPHLGAAEVRVSALQWALLIRVRRGATPRDLAWALRRSVFGTTIEVYRLLALRLITVPRPVAARPVTLSFIRAAASAAEADKKGGSMPDHVEPGSAAGGAG